MRRLPVTRAHLPIVVCAVFALVAACGFNPQTKSGVVACKPAGAACCSEGYICVGRGAVTAAGPSQGACWNKDDLPLPALAATHDYTPTVLYDLACLVTDWLPPSAGGPDGGVDSSVTEADTGMSPGGLDSGGKADLDVALGQDTSPDLPLSAGGTTSVGKGGATGTGGAAGTGGAVGAEVGPIGTGALSELMQEALARRMAEQWMPR